MKIRDKDISGYGLAALIICGLILLAISITGGYYAVQMHKIDAEINAQKEVERTEIEQKAATQRTRERMHWLPWYSDEKNEVE